MDLADLATFGAVARSGGITRAARALNTVQSNVTARISRLEQELGVRLFERHSRGVSLTAAGRQLLPYVARVTALLDEAHHAVAGDGPPRGPLRLGAMETTAALRLPPVLAAFTRACPEVELEVRTGTSAELVEEVAAHRLDGALVGGPVRRDELVAEAVLEEELVLVTGPAISSLAEALPAGGDARLLVFRAGCAYRGRLEQLVAARDVAAARRLDFGTLEGIIGCVAAGLGVTLLPLGVVEPAAGEGRVAIHRLPEGLAKVPTVLVRRAQDVPSPALVAFLACLKGQLRAA